MAEYADPNASTAPVVEPISQSAAPPVEPQTPPETTGELDVPDEIQDIPAVQAVAAGAPPAVSTPLKEAAKREEFKLIADNMESLLQSGIGFYKSLSGQIGVMFNMLKLHPDDLIAADKAGKLSEIAPDFDSVNQKVAGSGINHPILERNRGAMPSGPAAAASAQSIPQSASGQFAPPAPASVIRKLAAQRVMNMQPGAPTSGPAPGAGRLLNAVLKPVV